MKKSLYKKKSVLVLLVITLLFLSACNQMEADSFIEIEKEAEQYKKMEQELKDLKVIKVKCLAKERFEEMKEVIYKNYFRNKEDKNHQQQETLDGVHKIIYRTEDMYQLFRWGNEFVSYSGELFGEDCIYETTEEQVIQEETEKLFRLLGLEYGDRENGYAIDKLVMNEDNSVQVILKKYIAGKEVSPTGSLDAEVAEVEDVELLFGNNQIIEIALRRLSETVEVKDYEEEVLVNSPQKAYKLLANYISSVRGTEKKSVDTVRIAYVTSQEKDGIYTLRPMAEFYEKCDTMNVYQVDLTKKEVGSNIYASVMLIGE